MKKTICTMIVVLILVSLFVGCSDALIHESFSDRVYQYIEENDTEVLDYIGKDRIIEYLYEDRNYDLPITTKQINDNSDEILNYMDETGDLWEYVNYTEGYPNIPILLGEAEETPGAVKMLFDFADLIEYWPSAVFGPYCFDTKLRVVHSTDSDCVENIAYDDLMSCWSFNCKDLSDVKDMMKRNKLFLEHEWTFCPECFP